MATPLYSTDAGVIAIAGQMGVDLRCDDATIGETGQLALAHAYAQGRIDFYCERYAQSDLATNQWVQDAACLIALHWFCMHRLNDVPKSVANEWAERKEELTLILKREANVPRAPRSRRPVTVTNANVVLGRHNNQIRVDRSRTTGVQKDYVRPTDDQAPDER